MRHPRVVALVVSAAAVLAVALAPIAQAAPAERAFALSAAGLVSFDPAAPAAATTKAITGVAAGETLVGLDVRPQNGMLYALGVNATADTGTLYVLGRDTAAASPVGTPGAIALTLSGVPLDLPAEDYGFDVNPTVDRIRVTTGSGLNFRLNPATGAPVDADPVGAGVNPDSPLNGAT